MNARGIKKGIELFREFTEFDPQRVIETPGCLPARVTCFGHMVSIMYASNKWEKKVNYYKHDFDEGVRLYLPGGSHGTPGWLKNVQALAKLGRCEGFVYRDGRGEENTVGATGCDLYSIPSGKALVVIRKDGNKVEAMMWGGRLDVQDRGIVH